MHVRIFIRRYQSLRACPSCNGTRLSKEPLAFTIGEKKFKRNLGEILSLSVSEARNYFDTIKLSEHDRQKSRELFRQINTRIEFLDSVGVSYLQLNRKGNSLSGGEYQRICLASQLGSKLSDTLYVLDEPSIGLHPEDTDKLIKLLYRLRDHGNTVVIVEHDQDIIKAADNLIEIGPDAGIGGGRLIAQGEKKKFLADKNSLTAKYINKKLLLPRKKNRRKITEKCIKLRNCYSHNLQNIDVDIPLGVLVAVTGVSGSGKSTLIKDTLYKALAHFVMHENIPSYEIGRFDKILGFNFLRGVSILDQRSIGRSSRSNPATYLKIYDEIRRIMACQPKSARQNLTASDFSFNVESGRCPTCKGDGTVEVDMHFMANIKLICDDCGGKRFKAHVLDVRYRDKNIYDILHTTIREALDLFYDVKPIVERLKILESVGLDYLQLGQSLSTLSGGEAQRLKIASSLEEQRLRAATGHHLYIFDEPTTGLHLHDINRLSQVLEGLVNKNHSVIFIEHNMELVALADYVIDIGPGGGNAGGHIVATGTPEEIVKCKKSVTGKHLKAHL